MVHIIDYQATEPIHKVDNNHPSTIPHSPKNTVLASITINIPRKDANKNRVELISTVGIRGISGTSQIIFKIFRDDKEIFRAQEGVEADPSSEVNYIVTLQAIDTNVGEGSHLYRVTAENITKGTKAAVVGPISFSGLAINSTHGFHNKNHD